MTANTVEYRLRYELDSARVDNPTVFSSFQGLDIEDPKSKGFLYGPTIGYVTSDKKLDFKLDMLLFGKYKTTVDTDVMMTANFGLGTTTQKVTFSIEEKMEQRDIDFQAGYMLTDLFRVFLGYRYQSMKTAFNYNYYIQLSGPTNIFSAVDFRFESEMHMPYLGAGLKIPVADNLIAAINGGIGVPVTGTVDEKLIANARLGTNYYIINYTFSDGQIEMAYMLFADASLAYTIMERVNLQLGYKYQRFTLKVKDVDLNADGRADEKAEELDVFHGVTFAAQLQFDL